MTQPTDPDPRPLAGVKVLDLSRVLSGPYATMMLANLGADVVKVERPGVGDDTRRFGPPFQDGVSTYFLSINRGKRSIALDLKRPEDLETCRKLAARADVLIENFRPGVMARLGLGDDALLALNPRLVVCHISGFGQGDPRPGYDLVIQGMGGVAAITGEPDGPPTKCGASIANLVTGLNAVQGILAALVRRGRTDQGGVVDVPMITGQQALLTYHATGWLGAGSAPRRRGNQHPSIHPYGTYETADGYVNVAVGNDSLWQKLCAALGQPAWASHVDFATNAARVEHRQALDALLVPLLQAQGTAHWTALLERAGVPGGPIWTVPESLAHAELVTHDHPDGGTPVQTVAHPVRIDGVPRAAGRRAPRVGEHTDEVLGAWLGGGEDSSM